MPEKSEPDYFEFFVGKTVTLCIFKKTVKVVYAHQMDKLQFYTTSLHL